MCTIGLTKGSRCATALTFFGSAFFASADLPSFTATTAPVFFSGAFTTAAVLACASGFFLLKGSPPLAETAPLAGEAVFTDGADFTATTDPWFEALAATG